MPHQQSSISVGVLGATGTVGQRFLLLLSQHPFFVPIALGASSRSAGKKYSEAVKWKQTSPLPEAVRDLVVQECTAKAFEKCAIVFSGLDADVAGEIEEAFRKHDLAVFSNAKNYRRDPLVPLVVPLVNPSHLAVAAYQRRCLSLSKGFIVTNANCSTTALVVPLQALEAAFGPLDLVLVTTMQAISGAGYPGVPSMDIMDNVVPYISGEEEKIEYECAKILGGVLPGDTGFDHHKQDPLRVSATCTRVPVLDGHTEAVSVRFARRPAPSVDDVQKALAAYASPHVEGCPSIPAHPIIFHAAEDRPQPRLDRDYLDGSVVHVGRIRTCNVLDVKFVLLGNNVALGAATSSIMNAEIAISTGLVTV